MALDKRIAISVIVPVYNAEKYLRRCIDSILAQTFTDFELLLVDDGSTDGSGVVCDEYAAKEERIRVFHKKNGGVSSARNLALDNVRGKWVAFVDSDDTVSEQYLDSLWPIADEDIVMDSSGFDEPPLPDRIWKGKDISDALTDGTDYKTTPWGKLFKLSLVKENGLCFDEKINSGEDTLFVFSYLVYVTCLRTTAARNYHYATAVTGSLSKKERTYESAVYFMENLYEVTRRLAKVYSEDDAITMTCSYYWRPMSVLFKHIQSLSSSSRRKFLKQIFQNKAVEHAMGCIAHRFVIGKKYVLFYQFGKLHMYGFSEYLSRGISL